MFLLVVTKCTQLVHMCAHVNRSQCYPHSQAYPVFVLQFALTVIHGNGRVAKHGVDLGEFITCIKVSEMFPPPNSNSNNCIGSFRPCFCI